MITTLIVLGAAFTAFAVAFASLAGLERTCAGRCDGAAPRRCDFCPERSGEST